MNSLFFCVKSSVYGGEAGDCCVKKEHEKRKLSLLRNHLKFYAIFVVDVSGFFSHRLMLMVLLSVDVGKEETKNKKKINTQVSHTKQQHNTKTRRMVEERVEEEKQRFR